MLSFTSKLDFNCVQERSSKYKGLKSVTLKQLAERYWCSDLPLAKLVRKTSTNVAKLGVVSNSIEMMARFL